MKYKNILITGGSGMVGNQTKFGIKPSRNEFDVLNPKSIEKILNQYKPEAILHLAAFTDMAKAEKSPEEAFAVNVGGTYLLARACMERDIHFTYLSSGAVFDGTKKKPYIETDVPHPLNVYGETKWLGEIVAQNIVRNALIIRTGWLFGGGKTDTKFVRLCFEKCRRGESIQATSDRQGSPTYIPDLLQKIKELIDKNAHGIVHIVNNGKASYYEIAKEVKRIMGCNIDIKPIKAADIESSFLKRGEMEALDSQKIHLRPWQEALKEYINSLLRSSE